MMLVMVHGPSGESAIYPVVWAQGFDNAYVLIRVTAQRKEDNRYELMLLISA